MAGRPRRGCQEAWVVCASRERLPNSFGDEWGNGVKQAQEIIERIHERPPDSGALRGRSRLVGECHLRNLNCLVAVLRPNGVVHPLRRLRESVLSERTIHIIGCRTEARRHPGAELPCGGMRLGCSRPLAGCLCWSRTKHVARGVPELVHEVARVLELLWREALVGAWCGAGDKREAQRVGTDLINHGEWVHHVPLCL